MALWKFGRSWPESVMRAYLSQLADRPVNFDTPVGEMNAEDGWIIDGDDALLGREAPGPPVEDGLFERSKGAIVNYDFSDPSIVVGHYDPEAPLVGRDMLLEIKVWGLRFLGGARVMEAREEEIEGTSYFGFRYDTLDGHIERGFEWFLLRKDHASGDVHFHIEAHWRLGQFPNWWSKVGFRLIGDRYRRIWRHRAAERLKHLARQPVRKPVADPGALAHRGDETPKRTEPDPEVEAGHG